MENPLVTILREKNITRPEMAKKTTVSYNTIYRLSTGYTNQPLYETLEKLAEYGGKDPQQMRKDWRQWREESLKQD